jgi:hypothetical protein
MRRTCLPAYVVFRDCRIDLASFAATDLHGCALDGVTGAASLRGAAMPWTDVVAAAGTLAAALGIRVLDDQ